MSGCNELLYPAGRGVVTAAIAALVFAMAGPPATDHIMAPAIIVTIPTHQQAE